LEIVGLCVASLYSSFDGLGGNTGAEGLVIELTDGGSVSRVLLFWIEDPRSIWLVAVEVDPEGW